MVEDLRNRIHCLTAQWRRTLPSYRGDAWHLLSEKWFMAWSSIDLFSNIVSR